MGKVIITFGLIAGLIVSVMMFITMPMAFEGNLDNGELIGYATMVIALSSIFFAVKTYRDKYQDGLIRFGKAFLIGLYVSLIASFLYAVSWELYLRINDVSLATFIDSFSLGKADKMRSNGASPSEISDMLAKAKQEMQWYFNPLFRFIFTMFVEMLPVGVLISLISALILKRKTAKNNTANA